MSKVRRIFHRWLRDTRGAVMVEFAIVCILFCTIIAGIIDLGLAYYVKQVVTNASREGARYGVVYVTDTSGKRVAPNAFTSSTRPPYGSIQNYVKNTYLSQTYLPTGSNPQVPTPTGTGYTSGNMGDQLIVSVSATYNWIILGHFIKSLGSSKTITATTAMLLE